jgi:hypothetical protein
MDQGPGSGSFSRIRHGIIEHLENGMIDATREWPVYSILHLLADLKTGVIYQTSAYQISFRFKIPIRQVQRALASLEKKAYIRRFFHVDTRKLYPVVIDKFITVDGLVIDAHSSKFTDPIVLFNNVLAYKLERCGNADGTLTERCGNADGTLTASLIEIIRRRDIRSKEEEVPAPVVAKKRPRPSKVSEFSPESEAFICAKFMADGIKEWNTEFATPNMQAWSKDFDLMIRVDKIEPKEICRKIKAIKLHDFWCDKILCPQKLRQKWKEGKLDKVVEEITKKELKQEDIVERMKRMGVGDLYANQ